MSIGGNNVRQTEPPCLARLQYNREGAWYPGGRRSRRTHPIPFIPMAQHSHCGFGDCFSRFTPIDLLCSALTGSPQVGCGSSPCTVGLGCGKVSKSATPEEKPGALNRPSCHPSVTCWSRYTWPAPLDPDLTHKYVLYLQLHIFQYTLVCRMLATATV
jgi:hypothetical protein